MNKVLITIIAILGFYVVPVSADEFSTADTERWMQQFEQVATKGRALWVLKAGKKWRGVCSVLSKCS